MADLELIAIDGASIMLFLAATGIILLTIMTRFKGMKKPPFWIYLFGGFLLITFHSVLSVFSSVADLSFLPAFVMPAIRLLGNLAVFIGVYKLYRSQSSSIKFDKEIG